MTPGQRVSLGALIGALFVLVLHPMTSSFYALAWSQLGPSNTLRESPLVASNAKVVRPPQQASDVPYFVLLAMSESIRERRISPEAARFARAVVREQSEIDRENAYWLQAAAVFSWLAGDRKGAESEWIQASQRLRWDDGQTPRIQSLLNDLQTEFRTSAAWHYAVLFFERSNSPADAVLRLARNFHRNQESGPEPRIASVLNGTLMREGARSIRTGSLGVAAMQEGTLTPGDDFTGSSAVELRRRERLLGSVRESNPDLAARLESEFRRADSWRNLVATPANTERREQRILWSMIVACLPGVMLHLAFFGLTLLAVGFFIQRFRGAGWLFDFPGALVMGLVLSGITFSVTKLFWPSLWVMMSLAFFVFQPSSVKSKPPIRLSLEHRITVMIVAAVMAMLVAFYFLSASAPGIALLPKFGVPAEYLAGSALVPGLALLMLSIAVFTAPVWSFATRHASVKLLELVFKEMGIVIGAFGLITAVATGPICFLADRTLSNSLSKTVLNEPNLYLSE